MFRSRRTAFTKDYASITNQVIACLKLLQYL